MNLSNIRFKFSTKLLNFVMILSQLSIFQYDKNNYNIFGKLAHLCRTLINSGHEIIQMSVRTIESASTLAKEINVPYMTTLKYKVQI